MTSGQAVDVLDIDDVLIHLRYTSKTKQGAFRTGVTELLRGS